MRPTRRDFINKTFMLAGYTISLTLSKLSMAKWLASDFRHLGINASLAELFPNQATIELI